MVSVLIFNFREKHHHVSYYTLIQLVEKEPK